MTTLNSSAALVGGRQSRLPIIALLVFLTVLLPGCFPAKVIVGVDEPDLSKIAIGDSRSDTEDLLGEPLWHVGVSDGLAYDIYQYEAEHPPEPLMGTLLLGFDVISFGYFDLSAHPRDLFYAKQVAVAYDNRDQVAFVSKPWEAQDAGPCRRQRYLIPKDAGVPDNASPKPLADLNGPALNTAILDDDDLEIETIDGHVPEDKVIELRPGRHEVEQHGVTMTVEFFPGRHYRMEHEHFYGYARYRPFRFIEDVDSRETLICLSPMFIHD